MRKTKWNRELAEKTVFEDDEAVLTAEFERMPDTNMEIVWYGF